MNYKTYKMEDALEAIIDYRGRTPEKSENGIETLSAKSVKNGYIDYSQCYFISREEYKKFMVRGFPNVGDVLLTTEAPMGLVARLDRDDVAIAQRLLTLRGKKNILDNDYLLYFLQSPVGQALLKARETGTTVTGIKQAEFRKIEITIPNIESQRKIAAVLRGLDDKISSNTKINDNLEQQAQVLVAQYVASSFEAVELEKLMGFVNGFAFQSKTYLSSGRYKIITIKNVQDGNIDSNGAASIDELPDKMKSNCILHVGDVLLSLTGNVGRVGIVYEENLLLNQRVAKLAPFNKELLPFFYFFMRQPSMKTKMESIAKGTAQLNLSPVETLKLRIPYDEDAVISLSSTLTPLYEHIVRNSQESLILAALRDSLLPKLMSGEIDVSDIQL